MPVLVFGDDGGYGFPLLRDSRSWVWVAHRPEVRGGEIVLGVLGMLVSLFLLIASPFFFRSLRWVAWTGWIIAVGLFLWGLLTPIS